MIQFLFINSVNTFIKKLQCQKSADIIIIMCV